jgi:hypothetical protein
MGPPQYDIFLIKKTNADLHRLQIKTFCSPLVLCKLQPTSSKTKACSSKGARSGFQLAPIVGVEKQLFTIFLCSFKFRIDLQLSYAFSTFL